MAVAVDTGVRRAAVFVIADKTVDDGGAEEVGEIEHVMAHTERGTHTACILDVFERAARVFADIAAFNDIVVAEKLHGDAHAFKALFDG